MQKSILTTVLMVALSFLSVFMQNTTALAKEVTLYANFSSGNPDTSIPGLIKVKKVDLDEVSVNSLANALSKWSGLDFTIQSVTMGDNKITVDWSPKSTLIANLDDRVQKKDFHFFDVDSMRWFMMDSLYQTITENLKVEEVYYTMNGGKELAFKELAPVNAFTLVTPYMGSAFYFAHSDTVGDE